MQNVGKIMRSVLFVLPGLAAACATQTEDDGAQTRATAQAVTVIECESQHAECLGVMPSDELVMMCEAQHMQCLDDAAAGAPPATGDFATCRDAAIACAQSAGSFADALRCRGDFETCLGAAAPSLPLPTFPGLPTPGAGSDAGVGAPGSPGAPSGPGAPGLPGAGLLTGAGECRDAAFDCAAAAAGSLSGVAACADGFRTCLGDLLTGGPSGPSDPDAGVVPPAVDPDASTPPVDPDASVPPPDPTPPSPGLPGLPGLPGFPGGGAGPGSSGSPIDCLANLNSCLLGGGTPTDCAAEARACAGF
jgi:hypothetical protein